MADDKYLSTSALAKVIGIPSKELFAKFLSDSLIEKIDDQWNLTPLGMKIGGKYLESKKFGRYIGWPESMATAPTIEKQAETRLTAKALGTKYDLSANKINFILSELGWIQKSIKGWKLTLQGEKLGGIQDEDRKSGIPFVRWPENIITNRALLGSIQEVKGRAIALKLLLSH